MIVLHGTGVGRAPAALGRAASVNWQNGRPTLDDATLAWLADRSRREEGIIQLVLVVSEASLALWMPMPFDAVLGAVVSEGPLSSGLPDAFPIPVVCDVPEARSLISDGMLVLVDSHRNRVCVEPSAEELLAVQSPSKRRWLVGSAHAPAVTRSGLEVPVIGLVDGLDAVREAVRLGADGVLFRECASRDVLREAARATGGGRIVFPGTVDDAFQLATEARVFHLSVGDVWDPIAWESALENSVPGSPVPGRVALPGDRLSGPWDGVDAVLVDAGRLPLPILELPPLWVWVDRLGDIGNIVAAGASAVCVPADDVAVAKDAVRECD